MKIRNTLCAVALAALSGLAQADFLSNAATLSLRTITAQEALNLFSFFTPYADSGERVRVVLPPKNGLSFKALAARYLHRNPLEYYESVQAKVYAGKANPVFAATDDLVIFIVSSTPYSIGYHRESIAINTGLGVRVLPLAE